MTAVAVYVVAHGTSVSEGVMLGTGEDGDSPIDACSQHPRAGGGGDTRAEQADPAASSLGDSALEGGCFARCLSLHVTLVQRTGPTGRGLPQNNECTVKGAARVARSWFMFGADLVQQNNLQGCRSV